MSEGERLTKIKAEIKENNLTWEAGENLFSDIPLEVASRLLGYNYESEGTTAEEEERKAADNYQRYQALLKKGKEEDNPIAVDWRNIQGKSYVTQVKNQGNCGSCVSFATIAAMESMARFYALSPEPSPVLPLLSEASLHFCIVKNCKGWNLGSAFSACQKTGVVTEQLFPYKGVYVPCNPTPEWDTARTKIKDFHYIRSIDDMISWLAHKGPLATRFNVYSDFYSYKKGIYQKTPSAEFKGGHAVLCVGYDLEHQAWICKNSWGSGWGEKGYFRIAMGECGIDACMYAIDAISPEYPVYMDVMMRDNFHDFGQSDVSGNLCKSPDIIPVGINDLDKPAETLKNNWFQDIGQNVLTDTNNVIYLRGISHSPESTTAKFYLYYSKASLLMYPEQWKDNLIPCSDGKEYYETAELSQGDVAVTEKPYIWKPSKVENDHYCFIGRVVTKEHPNPIPNAEDVRDFARFIAQNPNYCMRNIALVDKDIPDYSVAVDYEQGKIGAQMHFVVENLGCSPDAEFSLSCTDSSLASSICISRQKVPADHQLTGISVYVPEGFQSKLLLNFWNKNSEKAQEGWELSLKSFYIVDDSELEELSCTVSLQYGSIKPEQAVLLGGYTIKAQTT